MITHTNSTCLKCSKSVNTINGYWCKMMSAKVEYSQTPPCASECIDK